MHPGAPNSGGMASMAPYDGRHLEDRDAENTNPCFLGLYVLDACDPTRGVSSLSACGESVIARTPSGIADENCFLQSRDANKLVFVARSSQERDCNFLVLRLETWG